jgi:hypothetical protein
MNRSRVYLSSIVSIVALAFLIYTLLSLNSPEIPVTHPRVIVEASIFLIGLILAITESRR